MARRRIRAGADEVGGSRTGSAVAALSGGGAEHIRSLLRKCVRIQQDPKTKDRTNKTMKMKLITMVEDVVV